MEKKILVIGIGNPSREDDRLGVVFAEKMQNWVDTEGFSNITIKKDTQINLEDASDMAEHDIVLYVDATEKPLQDFVLTSVSAEAGTADYTSHENSPGIILHLCRTLYNKCPEVYVLHIKGYEWNFCEEVTPKAGENLRKALDFIKKNFYEPEKFKNYVQDHFSDFRKN